LPLIAQSASNEPIAASAANRPDRGRRRPVSHDKVNGHSNRLQNNPLDLIERDLVVAAVVKLGRAALSCAAICCAYSSRPPLREHASGGLPELRRRGSLDRRTIGASGGQGLNDTRELLGELPPTVAGVIMVVLHRLWHCPSNLHAILSAATALHPSELLNLAQLASFNEPDDWRLHTPMCRVACGGATPSHRPVGSSRPVIRVGVSVPARAWLLLSGLFLSLLCRLMMTDRTAGGGAGNRMMPGDMSGDPTDYRPLQTPRRMRRFDRSRRQQEQSRP
jgi:hypothetical protein